MKQLSISIFFLGLILISCQSTPEIKGFGIKEMTAQEFKQHFDQGGVQVIDVRTPQEYENGHIEGAINMNIGNSNFSNELDKLDKNKLYLMHCAVGGRSARAFEIFQAKGFKNVGHLTKGLMEWQNAGYEVVK